MSQLAAIKPDALRPRHLLTVVAVSLVVIGCLSVLSAADGSSTGSAFSYFAKATVFGAVGCFLMVWLGRGGRHGKGGMVLAHRVTTVILVTGFAGVLFAMVPTPITQPINGARQWIQLPGFTIQPSEILKPAIVLHLALVFARDPWRTRSLRDLAPALGVAAAALFVIGAQDLGSTIVTAAVILTVLFAAGVSTKLIGGFMALGAAGAAGLIMIAPERMERMTVFLAPFADRYDSGFQITNGLMAIGSGGIFGNGIGESLQKHIIPEPQTDFILPVIMEEVGLLGATVIMALYVALVMLGLRIARGTKDPYERLVAVGLTSIILWQAALNVWAVLGIAPLTGVPLPLISAGSTSQLILLAVVGLLIDIDRRSAMPTVALVLPKPAPVAVRRAAAEVGAMPEPDSVSGSQPDPQPGEVRATDRRIRISRAQRAGATPTASGAASKPARGGKSAAVVLERVAGLEILSDGTVRLPNGSIGRPRSPISLGDGRVLMPDGKILSAERATLAAARSHRPA